MSTYEPAVFHWCAGRSDSNPGTIKKHNLLAHLKKNQ